MYVEYFVCDHCGWDSQEYPAEARCPYCAVTPCDCHENIDCPDQPPLGMVYQGPPGGHTFYRAPPRESGKGPTADGGGSVSTAGSTTTGTTGKSCGNHSIHARPACLV